MRPSLGEGSRLGVYRQPEDPVIDQEEVGRELALYAPVAAESLSVGEGQVGRETVLGAHLGVATGSPVELVEGREAVVVGDTAAEMKAIREERPGHAEGVGDHRLASVHQLHHQSSVGAPAVGPLPPHGARPGEGGAVDQLRCRELRTLIATPIRHLHHILTVALRTGDIVPVGEGGGGVEAIAEAVAVLPAQVYGVGEIGIALGVKVVVVKPSVIPHPIVDIRCLDLRLTFPCPVIQSEVGAEIGLPLSLMHGRLHTEGLRQHPCPLLVPECGGEERALPEAEVSLLHSRAEGEACIAPLLEVSIGGGYLIEIAVVIVRVTEESPRLAGYATGPIPCRRHGAVGAIGAVLAGEGERSLPIPHGSGAEPYAATDGTAARGGIATAVDERDAIGKEGGHLREVKDP